MVYSYFFLFFHFYLFKITSQTYTCVLPVIGGINEDGVHRDEHDESILEYSNDTIV